MAPQARTNHRIYASNSSTYGFRLVDSDHTMDTLSSQGRNSIYKMKIDSMFDDSRSIISQRYDDGMRHRRRSSSNYGSGSMRSTRSSNNSTSVGHHSSNSSNRVSNSVQAQIERMFSDVENETVSCSFAVRCLGSLPLKDKVTSLSGLQEPLRQLYLTGAGVHGNQNAGTLEICPSGLRIKMTNNRNTIITPFSNIAVWSAVKFVVSQSEGGAAFLPLITDPENIDKSCLFRPLNAADKRRLSSGIHSPLFAVVMRSTDNARQLECHAYVCQSPETAIVLAATLYQSLMAHMSNSKNNSKKKVKTHNGISRMSVASSQATTNLVQSIKPPSILRSDSQKSSKYGSVQGGRRKRRPTNSSVDQGGRDIIRSALIEVSSEERSKKKSSKSRRAPPIPTEPPPVLCKKISIDAYNASMSYLEKDRKLRNKTSPESEISKDKSPALSEKPLPNATESTGDILTKVAIPRSGSFLNTGGLTRYKSKNNRRNLKGSPTSLGGGGGGSPLGFSELFQEFRLQENLHSLDEILNAIINTDGMSYNNLKPIYKEFLLKLAVTLTKDELYQRSKSIMRRQKKKKVKKQKKQQTKRKSFVSVIGLKQVFKFGHFRNGKATKDSKIVVKAKGKGKAHHFRSVTSGSEVSVVGRHEHTISGQHRNSSSGYVSCSECSYDSDACTCASADRCYCSMGGDSHNELHAKLTKCKSTNSGTRRDSLPSCNSEDKCYCSMPESSAASTCSSDSCASADKCYCAVVRKSTSSKNNSNSNKESKCANNLSLDYELFTTGDGSRHVKPVEALSVKKSVEAAALFADIKLSQTTDIKNLGGGKKDKKQKKSDAKVEEKKQKKDGKRDSKEINTSIKSSSSEVVLRRNEHQKNALQITKSNGYYQTIPPRPISTSLEDSLGYLP
ncbi:uncharacterized protein LOC134837712 [Culicoides brevitarsis]|uniref:uncharacterized protein LOC134837712 n=1 Tax=Culicoides brevitarsis TaxID=469753 RepID=UPI00307B590D